jgi:methylmalonyl-CoA mutase cobalamin-binding subunit
VTGVPPRRCVIALAGDGPSDETTVRPLLGSLRELGIDTVYVGRAENARRIAEVVAAERADAVELCLTGRGGIPLLRDLLRELVESGRRDVSIVVHRTELLGLGGFRP